MTANDDYLWDRNGPADPEVAALERLLAAQGLAAGTPRRRRRVRPRRRWRIAFAAAAVLALCAIGVRGWYQQRLQWDAGRPWQVVAQQGEVRIDGRGLDAGAQLAPGGTLETGTDGITRLRAAGIGELALGESSRLRLLETGTGRHRVQLQQGSLWVRVWAPPGQFGVGVAGADVVDLGCEFLLEVDADGIGSLHVLSGWVQVDNLRREVLVPEGTQVRLRGSGAAGTPHARDADAAFIAALYAIDARQGRIDADGDEVQQLLASSRPQDAISLLSLLQAHPHLGDGPMLERMGQLLPDVPASRERWLSDRGALLDAWWQALPYPRIKQWWMQWPDALPLGAGRHEAWLRGAGAG